MFHANYREPAAQAYRAAMNRHYVECVVCGTDVCSTYADTHIDDKYRPCPYRGDSCEGGYSDERGPICDYCD